MGKQLPLLADWKIALKFRERLVLLYVLKFQRAVASIAIRRRKVDGAFGEIEDSECIRAGGIVIVVKAVADGNICSAGLCERNRSEQQSGDSESWKFEQRHLDPHSWLFTD